MNAVSQKSVVVTGGAGFIGSHLCDRLLHDGHQVLCVDNLHTGSMDHIASLANDPRFEFLQHDVAAPLFVHADEVFNLAFPGLPSQYRIDPIRSLKTSVIGAANMLDLARHSGARFLQASAGEVYGQSASPTCVESEGGHLDTAGPRACHDEGKRSAETLCFDMQRMHALRIKVARIFDTYGPRTDSSGGRVVSTFILQALRNEPITVHGNGLQTRSFCYVGDLVDGLVRLMAAPDEVTGPINLGSPDEHTVREVAEKIIALTGSRSVIVERPLPPDESTLRLPDIGRARQTLDWAPKVSLEDGLQRTIAYFEERLSTDDGQEFEEMVPDVTAFQTPNGPVAAAP